jgi:hypothetical protein
MNRSLNTLLLWLILLTTACDRVPQPQQPVYDPAMEAEKIRLDKERKALEAQKADFDREVAREKEKKRRETIAKRAKHAGRFFVNGEAVVVSPRCYFHGDADPTSVRRSYLVQGDRVIVARVKRDFVWVDFYNENNGKSTSGWIDTQDLEPV